MHNLAEDQIVDLNKYSDEFIIKMITVLRNTFMTYDTGNPRGCNYMYVSHNGKDFIELLDELHQIDKNGLS